MAGKLEGLPSPSINLSPPRWSPNRLLVDQTKHFDPGVPYFRSVSSDEARNTPRSTRDGDDNFCFKWHIAMQCKHHVGTREWIHCHQESCDELRNELHHLLDCRYKVVGGCKERCIPLKQELSRFRHLKLKYPTISHTQLGHRRRDGNVMNEGDKIQAKLQALNIEEYVSASSFSPSSPAIEEPLQGVLQRDQEMNVEEAAVELVPLNQKQLSVTNGCFRKGHEWVKLTFLGKGSFGTTYLCYDRHKMTHFAIKKVPSSEFEVDEVKIWERLSGKHPNILDLYGAVERQERVLIFMEYMNGGSVSDYLAKCGRLRERMALQLLHQVLSALDFMHRNCIVHGDVKGANVLIDDLGLNVKLADFGSCVDLRSIEVGRTPPLAGTLAFMAPEVCRSEMPSTSSDIWSSMCFLIQMLSGAAPWDEYRHQLLGQLLFVIGSAKRPPQLPSCSEPVQDMFAQGFKVDACSRPTAAELLRHRVFDYDEEDTDLLNEMLARADSKDSETVEEDSFNDDSLEYHSSQSPFCSDLDLSDEEYFSSTDDLDQPDGCAVTDGIGSSKAKSELFRIQRFDDKGGILTVNDAVLEVPARALEQSTRLGLRCVDPVHFYQPLIDNHIYEDVKIVGHAHHLSPAGQKFRESLKLKLALPEEVHQSEDLTILHGTRNETRSELSWNDITASSEILPFKGSTSVTVSINHFSFILLLKNLPSLAGELLSSYFNFQAVFFRFLVLVRDDPEASGTLDLRLVMIRDSFYAGLSSKSAENFSVCRLKKDKGFRMMYGSRREPIMPREKIEISMACSFKITGPRSHYYCVQSSFGGEIVAKWTLDCSVVQEALSGTVTLKRSAGQVYRFQFWEHEPTRYVQDVLRLDTLTYANMIPVAKAVGIDQEQITKLVEESSNDEERQLKLITELWEQKAENNELTSLNEFIAQVPRKACLVSDRGKFHLGHLSDFHDKWYGKIDRDGAVREHEVFFRRMAENGREMCQSVFSDCLLQIDHSDDAVRLAANTQASLRKIVEKLGERYPEVTSKRLNDLICFLADDKRSIPLNAEQAQNLCQQLSRCVPWLIQIVKDLFKVQVDKAPTGMWGLSSGVSEVDGSRTTEEDLSCSEVWCQICEALRKLCEMNPREGGDNVDLEEMEATLDIVGLLGQLSVDDEEWKRLTARVKYFRFLSKEIVKNKLSRISKQDLQNILQWLRSYITFCPTRLVRFGFRSLSDTVVSHPLQYDEDSKSFYQQFSLDVIGDVSVIHFVLRVEICISDCKHSELVEGSLKVCEEIEENHEDCRKLIVVYDCSDDGTGVLRITNECKKWSTFRMIEGNMNQPDNESNKDVASVDPQPRIKEGSPSFVELHEIAENIPKEWKSLGRLLRPSAVDKIDIDESEVVEKAIKMLEAWKKGEGSAATYVQLYNALCHDLVSRTDIAEKYCLYKSGGTEPQSEL